MNDNVETEQKMIIDNELCQLIIVTWFVFLIN